MKITTSKPLIPPNTENAMIRLEYSLSSLWCNVAALTVDFGSLTKFELSGEVFFGEALIVVNAVDLSWHLDLPMLDFARSLFLRSVELSPLEPEAYVSTLDYNERLYLTLFREREVLLSPDYSCAEAICDLGELIAAAASFGLGVYTDFTTAYPEARRSGVLDEWYPISAMRRISVSNR